MARERLTRLRQEARRLETYVLRTFGRGRWAARSVTGPTLCNLEMPLTHRRFAILKCSAKNVRTFEAFRDSTLPRHRIPSSRHS